MSQLSTKSLRIFVALVASGFLMMQISNSAAAIGLSSQSIVGTVDTAIVDTAVKADHRSVHCDTSEAEQAHCGDLQCCMVLTTAPLSLSLRAQAPDTQIGFPSFVSVETLPTSPPPKS
jgi:hypothetical protein